MTDRKIVIFAAEPGDLDKLQLEKEEEAIRECQKNARLGDQFEVIVRDHASPDDLRQWTLNNNPEIVHFCGHGTGRGGLAFEDVNGQVQLVSAGALAGLFEILNDVQCVVLNACYSEVQAREIVQYINYVIGMSQGIGDAAAIDFSRGFYDGLMRGMDFEDAFKLGRNAIQWKNIPLQFQPSLKRHLLVDRAAVDLLPEHLKPQLLKRIRAGSEIRFPDERIIYAGLFLYFLSLATLLGSYFVTGSPAWKVEFGWFFRWRPDRLEQLFQTGWLIESIRTIICVFGFVMIIGKIFRAAAAELLLQWSPPPLRDPRWFWGCRALGLTLMLIAIVNLGFHHFVNGPRDLSTPGASRKWLRDVQKDPWRAEYANLPERWDDPEFYRYYRLPFLLYLPYSVINFVVIAVPLATVTIYAAGLDLREIKERTNGLSRRPTTGTCEGVLRRFSTYTNDLLSVLNHQAILCCLITSGILVDVVWGQFLMSKRALYYIGVAYIILLIGMALACSSVWFYVSGIEKTSELLRTMGCRNELDDFEKEQGLAQFLRLSFRRSVWISLTIVQLVLSVVFLTFFKLFPPTFG
jgi:hypothetical protein